MVTCDKLPVYVPPLVINLVSPDDDGIDVVT